jgi:hypothetical protein
LSPGGIYSYGRHASGGSGGAAGNAIDGVGYLAGDSSSGTILGGTT